MPSSFIKPAAAARIRPIGAILPPRGSVSFREDNPRPAAPLLPPPGPTKVDPMRLRFALAALTLLAAPVSQALAATYYVAPVSSPPTCTSDGTLACPFASITAAFSSKKIIGGDTVLLMDGDHAGVDKMNFTFDSMVTIQSQNGSNARIPFIHFDDTAKNIRLRNLKIWRDDGDVGTTFLIRTYSGASYLTFENLELRSRQDSNNYLAWTADRWNAVATTAMDLRGSYITVRNCTLTGVRGGIYMGPNALVENNIVDGFAEDGMKGVSNSTFRNNLVKNAFSVISGYHRDGFQAYTTPDAPITNLVLDSNTIIQWTQAPGNPLMGSLQGVGMFDGWYDNLTIRNNLVVTDHSHGISVYGTRGAKILNNTVVDLSGLPGTVPWIMLSALKDGTPSQNVVLANNVAMQIAAASDPANNVVVQNNSVILDPATTFQGISTLNYRPTTASGFIDTADAATSTTTDILGTARPSGAAPDRGAYEVVASTTTSGSTSTSGGTTTSSGGTTTSSGGTTTSSGGTTSTDTGGTTTTSGGGAKFVKPPKKK